MPSPVLHQGCTLTCRNCLGPIAVQQPTQNTVLKVNGHNVLVREDTFTVTPGPTCPGQSPQVSPGGPCDVVRFAGASVSPKMRIGAASLHVLLQDGSGGSVGCTAPPGPPNRSTVRIQPNTGPLQQM